MTETYFAKFPKILYSNTQCADLTRRVRLDEKTRNTLTLYYTYEVKDGTRPDMIADAYYEDGTYDWLIWITNDMIDPYTQWNLREDDFNSYLVKKYGSIENSQERIAFYRNNWYEDDNVITPDFYDNVLEPTWKKYYAPVYDQGTRILYWKRREDDWTMETNEIWKAPLANNTFEVGDLIVAGAVSASPAITVNTTTFNGEVSAVDDEFIYVKNVAYTVDLDLIDSVAPAANTHDYHTLEGGEIFELVYRAIELDEAVFWSPVSYYDIENERNVYNQSIRVLDRSQILNTTEQIRQKLKE